MNERAGNSAVRNFVIGLGLALIFFGQSWHSQAQQLPPEVYRKNLRFVLARI